MYPIDFFWRSVRAFPSRPAVIYPGGTLTFTELAQRVVRRAAALRQQDPERGTHVAVGAANTIDHLVTILATLAAGKVWIPLNPRNGDSELHRMIEFVSPALVVADRSMQERLGKFNPTPMEPLESDDASVSDLPLGPLQRASIPLGETQAIKFTGGTTGVPKGVQQPYRAWNTNIVTTITELRLGPDDRYLVSAPLTHGTSTYMLPIFAMGGALVFPEDAKAPGLLDTIQNHRCTVFFAPPTLVITAMEEQRRSPRDLSSLRTIIYGAAPMRPSQITDAQNVFGPIIATSYGQTEAPQIIAFLRPEHMSGEALASVGYPTMLTKVAILDDDGKVLPEGETGEISVRGDLLMSGYLNAPDVTSRTIVDGWLRTGDVGVLNDGLLFIRDRSKDVIITGGFNVYPSDVESVLARHPAVLECAVVGVQDEKWGEAVHAAVQRRQGVSLDTAELAALVRKELGPVKVPKGFHSFDALPRTAVGKILKTAVRDEIAQRLGRDKSGT